MQVQINLNAPFEYKAGQKIKPFDFCGDIVLATDPGKTNMAMAVGTPFGTQLCILQFRAPGSAYDTSVILLGASSPTLASSRLFQSAA